MRQLRLKSGGRGWGKGVGGGGWGRVGRGVKLLSPTLGKRDEEKEYVRLSFLYEERIQIIIIIIIIIGR